MRIDNVTDFGVNGVNNVSNAVNENVGELRGLLSSSREQKLNAVILNIPVRLFAIDSRYQTEVRTERELTYLIKNWDENKLLPVTGVPHDEEGLIYLVDGYGRWKASQFVNPEKYQALQCMVLLNAPKVPEERLIFEAEQYAFQNKNVAKLTPLQKHGAYEVMQDPVALAIDELKEKYMFSFSKIRGRRRGGVIGSYTSLYNICKTQGRECADWMLEVLQNAGFNIKAEGYSVYIFTMMRDAWKYYPREREEIGEMFSSYLRFYDPIHIKADAISKYKFLSTSVAVSLYGEDIIVQELKLRHKRKIEDNRVVPVKKAA